MALAEKLTHENAEASISQGVIVSMCQSDIEYMSFYELKNVSKKALWAAVTFYLKVLVILLPLSLFM